MSRKFTNEFRNDAVEYRLSHPDLTHKEVSDKLGISTASLYNWINEYKSNDNKVELRGSGNFASNESKENARLKKELKDTKDALEILKKAISILGD